MNREIHCFTCYCDLYSVVEAARHELEGHRVFAYAVMVTE